MNNLTTNEKIKLIEDLIELKREADSRISDINNVLNTYEFPFADTFYKLLDKHVNLVEDLVGDECNWVNWYIWDNSCGFRKQKVTINGKTFTVDNVKKLVTRVLESKKS